MNNEFTKENLLKAKKIILNNKFYNKEKDLKNRIQMFEIYNYAKNWIKKYKENEKI
tara:strand:+ start:516 stop:683 length:168 start_codon:yes stop_codon:yes gene_type:complete